MKKETAGTVAARITLLEAQEARLAMTIQFPPPSCRNVHVWRQVQLDRRVEVRRLLGEQREIMGRLSIQLHLALGVEGVKMILPNGSSDTERSKEYGAYKRLLKIKEQ